MPVSNSIQLKDVPLFRDLTPGDLKKFSVCLKEKSFVRDDILFLEGDACDRIFIVKSGQIKVFRTSSLGKDQVLEMLGPGDTCACNPGADHWSCSSSAQALRESRVWFFSRDKYIELVQSNSRLSRTLNRIFAERLCRFSTLIKEVSLDDPKRRLVKFILNSPSSHNFTHEEIAQRIGLVRETVTRHLNQLKKAGLVDLKPHHIIITDLKGLQKTLH